MSRASVLAVLLLAAPAFAVPAGRVDPHAAPPTGFPGAYLGSISMSLRQDDFYGSRFLDAFQVHLKAVASMTAPPAVAAYLAQSSGGGRPLPLVRKDLGVEALTPPNAAAILIANALARPDQFREVVEGLETLKPGLGKHSTAILREVNGKGDKKVLAALRAAGEYRPVGDALTYGPDGRFETLFDGSPAVHDDGPPATPRSRAMMLPERP